MKALYQRPQTRLSFRIYRLPPSGEVIESGLSANASPDTEPRDLNAVIEQATTTLSGRAPLNVDDLPDTPEIRAAGDEVLGLVGQAEAAFGGGIEDFLNNLGLNEDIDVATFFRNLMDLIGENIGDSDSTTSNGPSGPSGPSGPDSGPMAEVPPNEEMPELDEEPSPEDMQMLRERSRNADVENMTNPAKNIAIETLRAHPGLTVTSGYRGPERNAAAGGAVGSDHLTGNAIDFGTVDYSIKRWVETAFPGQVWADIHGSGGSGPANHLHVSYRPGGNRIA